MDKKEKIIEFTADCYHVLYSLYNDAVKNQNSLNKQCHEYARDIYWIFQDKIKLLVENLSIYEDDKDIDHEFIYMFQNMDKALTACASCYCCVWVDERLSRLEYEHLLVFFSVILSKFKEILDYMSLNTNYIV